MTLGAVRKSKAASRKIKVGFVWGGSVSLRPGSENLPREQRAGCQPNTGDHFPFMLHDHCLDHKGHPRPLARRWYHAPVGVLPRGGWTWRQEVQCGRSRVGEEGDARVNSGIQSGVWRILALSAFICSDAFLQAEFPLFSSSLQNVDTPV